MLCDGPGIDGAGSEGPTPQAYFRLGEDAASPDPYALFELSRDLRPPDYATLFARLAVAGSGLDEPIAVTTVYRPGWLTAVAAEPGVADTTLPAALAMYARPRERTDRGSVIFAHTQHAQFTVSEQHRIGTVRSR